MEIRIGGPSRVDLSDRHREHDAIADARVLAVADNRRAVVEEHAKQGDRLGKRRRRTGKPRYDGERQSRSTVHGGLQSNLAYPSSQACRAEAPARRRMLKSC